MDDQERALKGLIVDAICGVGFPSSLIAQQCELAGLARYTGGNYGPAYSWEWSRSALLKNPIDKLQELYEALCSERDEALNGIAQPQPTHAQVVTCQ